MLFAKVDVTADLTGVCSVSIAEDKDMDINECKIAGLLFLIM